MMKSFNPISEYSNNNGSYHLLPFKFERINNQKEVLVNELGDFLIVESGTAKKIADKEIKFDDEIYTDLISNFFISEHLVPPLIDVMATKYRTKKSFLNDFASLHIFVPTLRCNQSCNYCQVSRRSENAWKYTGSGRILN